VHVQVDEAALAGAPGHDMVEPDRLALERGQRLLDLPAHLGLDRHVHQAVGRAPDEQHPLAHDVARHADGHHRVQPEPAGEVHADQSDDDADGSPHVGDQVPGIGLQRDRAHLRRLAQHRQREAPVEQRGRQRQRDAQPDRLDRPGMEQPLAGRADDGDGRGDDQHALEAAGEVLGLVMPVRVALVGRLSRPRHHHQREQRADQIHQPLDRVGEQAHRPADVPGTGLEPDGGDGDDRGELEVGTRVHAPLSPRRRPAQVRVGCPSSSASPPLSSGAVLALALDAL